jgi:hypothetical protein
MPNVHHATRGRGRVPARGITQVCPIVGELLAPSKCEITQFAEKA